MGEKLLCRHWIENSKAYFMQNDLEGHMIEHPLGKECIEFLLNHMFVGYSDEWLLAKANLEIIGGSLSDIGTFSDFSEIKYRYDFKPCKYAVQFHKEISGDDRIEAVIHEMTHVHYLEIQFVTSYDEKLIHQHARQFVMKNKEYCKEIYARAMRIWKPYGYRKGGNGMDIYVPKRR